ncbi:MAG: hypothetical protein HXX13_16465 [Bacteroidetes bacterium]|nr:hypothetical protein [Bacteroidota bacterium]
MPKIIAFVIILIALGLGSCVKQDSYPAEPVIKFEGFGVLKDINQHDSLGELTVSYTDGDGDIGLYDSDTVEPYKYNFFLKFFYLKNNQRIELIPTDTALGFNARIPVLTPGGKNKNIKGNISFDLELYYAWPLLGSDTIAFEVYIKDRALHSSNVVQTPLFVISKP